MPTKVYLIENKYVSAEFAAGVSVAGTTVCPGGHMVNANQGREGKEEESDRSLQAPGPRRLGKRHVGFCGWGRAIFNRRPTSFEAIKPPGTAIFRDMRHTQA